MRVGLNTLAVAVIALSIYIGVEIDYRHWSWVLFLVLVPAGTVALRLWHARKKTRASAPPDGSPV